MTTTLKNPSRRTFLQSSAALGGGLVIGVHLPQALAKTAVTTSMPNAWVRIGSDNTVTILCARSEMGQGVAMAMPTLVAEELEVDLHKIKVEFAPPGEVYINTMLGGQLTGGSTSVRDGWDKLRIAGAQARIMLTEAAAQKWGVDAAKCHAHNAIVTGPGGKKASYGQLAEAASKLTPPKEVKLKDPSKFRYVGKPLHRLDSADKVRGKTEFGIDVKLPGMLYASLAQCPVMGGKVVRFDADKAKGMPGVKHVVQITDGVAVLADSWWRAKSARDALDIEWDEGPNKSLSSEAVSKGLADALAGKAASIREQGDVAGAMKAATKTLQATYEMPFLSHSPLEPMNFTADVRKDSALLIGSIQFQQAALGMAAAITGLKPEQITVRTTYLGGGFGRRIDLDYMA
ncbi:MAG: molybdopterin cofactor-binding domain-containing protein, partial [Burkholderiales bacterium]